MNALDRYFFHNIGKQFKSAVRLIFYVEAALTILGGVGFLVYSLSEEVWLSVVLVPLAVVVAIGLLWLPTAFFYGFGEMVDTAIAQRGQRPEDEVESPEECVDLTSVDPFGIGSDRAEDENEDEEWMCPLCEGDLLYVRERNVWYCPDCDAYYEVEGDGWNKHLKKK